MKLAQLMNATDKLRKLNARLVKIVGFKKGYDKQGKATAICKTYTPLEYSMRGTIRQSRDHTKYVSSIKFMDKALNVKVSCSCPDHLYRNEFLLHSYGAADIIYGNGEPPLITRQDDRPQICKHLVALRLLIKEQESV